MSRGRDLIVTALLLVLASGAQLSSAAESRYFYDALNRLTKIERADGIVVTYTYDALGNRLTKSVIHDMDFDGVADAMDNCANLANPAQTNGDGDAAGDVCDCAPTDGTAFAVPAATANVAVVDIPGGFRFTWTDQVSTTGNGTKYDVFSGGVSALRPGGDFSTGSCLSDNQAGATMDYTGPMPAAGEAFYFLIRGQNACPSGTGTYGNTNRDSGAGQSSSPCN